MEIPDGTHQFNDEKALLVTTGKQTGRIFFARKGIVKEIDEAFVPTPKYSDREGFFGRSGKGKSYGSGAPYESKDGETKKKFIKLICAKIEAARKKNKADVIYLFSPNYEITELQECLAKDTRNLIRFTFMGNFAKFSPEVLLQKIDAKLAKLKDKTQVLKPEESKILSKPRETAARIRRQIARTGNA